MPFNSLKKLIQVNLQSQALTVMLIRHAESQCDLSKQVSGWSDTKLTIKGREQANKLFQALSPIHNQFDAIYSSDLRRASETAYISLGFPSNKIFSEHRELRECHFGKMEKMGWDLMDEQQKQDFYTKDKQFENGESWIQVRNRGIGLFQKNFNRKNGKYMGYTHQGLIWTLCEKKITNCSIVCLELDQEFKPKEVKFEWEFPNEKKIVL